MSDLRKLAEALVDVDPIEHDREEGSTCHYCGAEWIPRMGLDPRPSITHAEDCPWQRMKTLLEETPCPEQCST